MGRYATLSRSIPCTAGLARTNVDIDLDKVRGRPVGDNFNSDSPFPRNNFVSIFGGSHYLGKPHQKVCHPILDWRRSFRRITRFTALGIIRFSRWRESRMPVTKRAGDPLQRLVFLATVVSDAGPCKLSIVICIHPALSCQEHRHALCTTFLRIA